MELFFKFLDFLNEELLILESNNVELRNFGLEVFIGCCILRELESL